MNVRGTIGTARKWTLQDLILLIFPNSVVI